MWGPRKQGERGKEQVREAHNVLKAPTAGRDYGETGDRAPPPPPIWGEKKKNPRREGE